MKKSLLISIIIFIMVAACALYLVINKGHIANISLVSTEEENVESEEEVPPTVEMELDKKFLSSNEDDEDFATAKVVVNGNEMTEGIKLTSSNEKVAKIDEENKIVPVSDGKVTITAEYEDITDTAELRVITPIKTMSFTSTNSTIRVNKDLQLKLKVTPSDAYMDTLTYTSSDESIATVSPDGIVTGIAPGKVTITLFDSYTETEKTVNLTIRK